MTSPAAGPPLEEILKGDAISTDGTVDPDGAGNTVNIKCRKVGTTIYEVNNNTTVTDGLGNYGNSIRPDDGGDWDFEDQDYNIVAHNNGGGGTVGRQFRVVSPPIP